MIHGTTAPPAPTRETDASDFRYVNRSVPRRDGRQKVTGRAQFASDLYLPGMAFAKLVRSSYGHARIKEIDVSRAMELEGVLGVVTGEDAKALPNPRYGHAVSDHPVLAMDKVRFVGEPVAAVVAIDERTAQEAAKLVRVAYEPLVSVPTIEEAISHNTSAIHELPYRKGKFAGIAEHGDVLSTGHDSAVESWTNICHHNRIAWGDTDSAFHGADKIVKATYQFPKLYAYAMEPYVTVADFGHGDVTVYSSAQHPYMVRRDLADVFGLSLSEIRLVVPYVGGGYGSKSYTKIEPVTVLCSRTFSRPVKLELSIDEAILTTRVASALMHLETACNSQGEIVARRASIFFDGGAYAENSPHGAHLSARHAVGPYSVPNVSVDTYLVYTNTAPASSFRGFSSTQVTFASESQIDELAAAVGIDAVEFRLRNIAEKGERIVPDARPLDGDLKNDLRLAAEAIEWGSSKDDGVGRGVAVMALSAGAYPVSTAEVRVRSDNSVLVLTGSTELGQGSETVFSQIAAEELGVEVDQVRVVRSDTNVTPFERSTGASRSTTVHGRALMEACRDVKAQLLGMAARSANLPSSDVVALPGGVADMDGGYRTWGAVIDQYFGISDCDAVGAGHVRRADELEELPVFWELSAIGVEVCVDIEVGSVSLRRLATVGDVGFAINPAMVEGQDLGAAIMGLGPGLFEELIYAGDYLLNGSILTYRVPRFSDCPRDVATILVQQRDGVGPYGAKGAGEGAISPMAPAIANAVADATGLRSRIVPITPQRLHTLVELAKSNSDETQ